MPPDLRKLKDKASEAFAKGKFAKAAEAYEEYCAADPKDLQARLRMGDAWSKSGKKDKAIIAYSAAAEGFAKEGFLPRAIAASKLILELDPSHKGVQKMLADLYARKSGPSGGAPSGPGAARGVAGPARSAAKPASVEMEIERKVEAPVAAFQRKDAIELGPSKPAGPGRAPPPKKPDEPPSPLNRADAIDLPEYEIPGNEAKTITTAQTSHRGPDPAKNLRAIELGEAEERQQGPRALENTAIELDVSVVGTQLPPPPPGPAARAAPPPAFEIEVESAAIPAPQPSVPTIAGTEIQVELEPVPGPPAEEVEVPIIGIEVAPSAPRPMPPPHDVPAMEAAATRSVAIELTEPADDAPPKPPAPLDAQAMEAAATRSIAIDLTEPVEPVAPPRPLDAAAMEAAATRSIAIDLTEPVETVEAAEIEVVETTTSEEVEVIPIAPTPSAPPAPVRTVALDGEIPTAPSINDDALAEAAAEMAAADPGAAAPASARSAVEPSAETSGAPPGLRRKPATPLSAQDAARFEEVATQSKTSRIWLPGNFAAPSIAPVTPAPAEPSLPAPGGADELSFGELTAEPPGASQSDLERGLAVFSKFDADDFLAPAPAAKPPPPPPPAVAPAATLAEKKPKTPSFTELELEGDSLLHAVETAAVVGLEQRGQGSSLEAVEEAMEAPDELKGPPEPGALPKIPLFSDLPEDAFIALFERCPLKRVEPGEIVIQQGSMGDAFYVICAGSVRVFRMDGERRRDIATLEEGAFFGEMALLSGAMRTASVEAATEDTQLLEISAPILTELSLKHPQVAAALKKFCRQRLLSNVMATAPLFQPFSKNDRRDLVQKFRARDVQKGDVLIKEGQSSDGMYVILSGEVEVRLGKSTVATLKEGDLFGEMSLLTKSPATATVAAARRTSLLRLPRSDFDMLIMSHPQVLMLVSDLVEQRQKQNAAAASQTGAAEALPMV